jgi:hypothetical protein
MDNAAIHNARRIGVCIPPPAEQGFSGTTERRKRAGLQVAPCNAQKRRASIYLAMNFALADNIVAALRVGQDRGPAIQSLRRFPLAAWQRMGFWLDASGLALYLWDAVRLQAAESALPPGFASRLRENACDNSRRTDAMLSQFAVLNAALENADIEYAVLKGFSLTPDFCPHPALRLQVDFDYLIRPGQISQAAQALRPLGYKPVSLLPFEARFATNPGTPRAHAHLYQPPASYTVEFHFSLFDRPEFEFHAPLATLDRRRRVSGFGLSCFALDQTDQFLHQALHAFQDVFLFSVRLSSLLETARFVHHRVADTGFWNLVRRRAAACDPRTGAMIGLVMALAEGTFGCAVADSLREWTTGGCPPAVALWVRRYGKKWCLHPFPGNKLSLLIAREFMMKDDWRAYCRRSLVPVWPEQKTHRRSSIVSAPPLPRGYRLRRAWFHVHEALRLACELPGWTRALREEPPRLS